METITITEAKTRFTEIADRVAAQHDRFTVTRNGRPYVMIISVAEWNTLHESISRLASKTA